MTISEFLGLCDASARALNIREATLSTRMLGDGKRLAAIRSGADIGTRRLEHAVAWISAHWPKDAVWPDDIPRPVDVAPASPSNVESQP